MNNINKIIFGNNEEYFEEIYPNIWIMHNHKWSLYCWEKYRENNKIPSTLVHLDYHWDACNDYSENESTIKSMNLNEMQDVIIDSNYNSKINLKSHNLKTINKPHIFSALKPFLTTLYI